MRKLLRATIAALALVLGLTAPSEAQFSAGGATVGGQRIGTGVDSVYIFANGDTSIIVTDDKVEFLAGVSVFGYGPTTLDTLNVTGPTTLDTTTVTGPATLDTLLVNGPATFPTDSTKFAMGDSTYTALRSASKIVNWNISLAEYMGRCFAWGESGCIDFRNNLDEFRAAETNNSLYRDEGLRLPTRGSAEVTDGGDTLRVVNLDTKAVAWSIVIAANNALGSSAITGVAQQDGHIFVATGSGVYDLDLWQDKSTLYSTAGVSVYNARLTSRNAASGFTVMSATPAIVNNTVYSVAVTRSPYSGLAGTDPATGMQWALWVVGTDAEASANVWKMVAGVPTMYIYDSNIVGANKDVFHLAALPGGQIFFSVTNGTRYTTLWWPSILNITGDSWGGSEEKWSNVEPGSEDIRWGNAAVLKGVAALPGLNARNSPRVYAAADSGLYLLDAKANDNTNGAKQEINRRYVSPIMHGTTVLAFAGASTADVSGTAVAGRQLINNNAVTFVANSDGPGSHYGNFVAASSQSLTSPDHADYTLTTAMSVGAWFYRDLDSGAGEGLVAHYDGQDLNWAFLLYVNGTGDIVTFLSKTTGSVSSTSPAINLSQWYYAVATYDGANQRLYLNGALVDTDAQTGALQDEDDVFSIGGWPESGSMSSFFDGRITGAFLSSTVMSAAEIAADYQRGLKFIESPTPDTLYVAPTGITAKDGLVYLWSASHVEVRDQGGALADTFRCTGCATIQTVAPWPTRTDSLAFRIGGSGGIRDVTPNAKLMDLATAEPSGSSRFKGINGVVVADSAGNGDAWTVTDAVNMAANVGIPVVRMKKGTINDVVTMSTAGMTLEGAGDSVSVINGGITGTALTVSGADVTVRNIGAQTTPGGGFTYDAFVVTGARFHGSFLRAMGSDDDCMVIGGVDFILTDSRFNRCNDEGIFLYGANEDNGIISNVTVKDQDGTSLSIVSGSDNHVIGPVRLDGTPTNAGTGNTLIYNDTAH
uniref:Putative lectin/glucanase superfamily protein n=1 Tax=viral metagenome TaxID=1070528 RepID=A0A6M3IMR0_9ZZZZ